MKTMEEKAAEVAARWKEFHPSGLSVADIRAARDQLASAKSSLPNDTVGPYDSYNLKQPNLDAPIDMKTIDWETWGLNMKKAIAKLRLIIEGTRRKNNNHILAQLKPPATWIQDIAVAEMEEWPGWWAVVEPEAWLSFCGDKDKNNGEEKAIEMANRLIELRGKK